MFQCHVCGSDEYHEELVSEVFQIEGKPVLVENIPARVCNRCGEPVYSRETTEKIRQMLHSQAKPIRTVRMPVFAYP
jgi:YgiT-type zinc finger domain-containing protein